MTSINRLTTRIATALCIGATVSTTAAPLDAQTVYPTGTTIWQNGSTNDGYTLFPDPNGRVHLVDMDGTEVRTWSSPIPGHQLLYPEPLDNGHILAFSALSPPANLLLELDEGGSIVWAFNILDVPNGPQARLHHDSERLANGNTLILAEQNVNNPAISGKTLGDDMILEVTPSGSIVWTWETHAHFDEFGFPKAQKTLISQKGGPWAHANSISVIPPNSHPEPAFAPGNIIISYRSINTIAIIDKASGNIVWNSGPNRNFTWGQHFPNMIPEGLPGAGNIIVFDNGSGTGYCNKSFAPGRSRVYEFDPSEWPSGDFVVWEYSGGQQFFSNWISAAMRLANGNTFICSGTKGRLFEVDPSGAIVWEYMNPHYVVQGQVKNHHVFRAYRLDYSWLP
jgi:hypothetical protein